MIVVPPIVITDAILTSSSIPEPDASQTIPEVTWTPGTRSLGEQFISIVTHLIYEVVVASTTDDPVIGVDLEPPSWIAIGPTNKFRMFDELVSSESNDTSPLTFDIEPGVVFNSVAGFGINADTINVSVTDPADGLVYDTDVDMNDYTAITSFYAYCFEPISKITEFSLFDLPAYPLATMTFTATSSGVITVGAFIIGRKFILGTAEEGTTIEGYDPSVRERDEFGVFTIIPKNTSDNIDFDFFLNTYRVKAAKNVLKSLSALTTPTVWADTGDVSDPTLVYGYFTGYNIAMGPPSGVSSGNVRIMGIV